MDTTKKDLIERGTPSNQQALVDLLSPTTIKPKKIVIPGGATMLQTIDKKNMEHVVYNWLRGANDFRTVTLSFAKDLSKYRLSTTRVVEFPASRVAPWLTQGRRWLARQMAEIINTTKCVAVVVDKDGISVLKDTAEKFSPSLKATKDNLEELKKQFPNAKVGDPVPNPDWEPYVEFSMNPRPPSLHQ